MITPPEGVGFQTSGRPSEPASRPPTGRGLDAESFGNFPPEIEEGQPRLDLVFPGASHVRFGVGERDLGPVDPVRLPAPFATERLRLRHALLRESDGASGNSRVE